jgi:hypothetical protein
MTNLKEKELNLDLKTIFFGEEIPALSFEREDDEIRLDLCESGISFDNTGCNGTPFISCGYEIDDDEICKERENVEEFNEYMYADIKNEIYDCVENTKEFGDVTGELDFVFSVFDYSFDCETEWIKYAKEHFNLEYNDAMDLYNKYKDEFITVDDMEEYIENLADESDDFGIDDNSCGECLIWVENPYYESIDDEEAA